MKKVTAIVAAIEIICSLASCKQEIKNTNATTEPIKEVISEQIETYTEEVKETTSKLTTILKPETKHNTTTKTPTTTKRITYGSGVTVTNPYISKNLGTFSLTFYVADAKWGYGTSTGVRSQHLATCAVDPNVIPLGSVIQITGNNGQTLTLKCVDVGGGIKGNKIDIFWDRSVAEGYAWMAEFGTIHSVYLIEN